MKSEKRIRTEIDILTNQRKKYQRKRYPMEIRFEELLIMGRINALKWVLEDDV